MSETPTLNSTPEVAVPLAPSPEVGVNPDTSPSFVGFEQRSKQISDGTIAAIMEDKLETVPGEKAFSIKSWLDQIPSDTSDAEFTHDPAKIVSFRDQLSDFVVKRLAIGSKRGALDDKTRAFLRDRKQEFQDKVIADKDKVADFVHHIDDKSKRPNYAVAEFYGMTIETSDGRTHDLLDGDGAGLVRSNIIVQRGITGQFVQYSSRGYERARLAGEQPQLERRIYLNPRIEDSVAIFDQIVGAAEEAGVVMKGKIFDRLAEGVDKDAREKAAGEFSMRADGIVLYAGKDADALLGLVEAVYKDHEESFRGRKTPKIPLKIADGVAIGDQPDEGSLTSHRAALLERAKKETQHRLGVASGDKAEAVKVFRSVYEQMAHAENVDPNNIAFNLKAA